MKKIYIVWFLFLAIVNFSCKKDPPINNNGTSPQNTGEVHPELKDGELIPGQYIVLYNNDFGGQISSKFKTEMAYEEMAQEVAKETSGLLQELQIPNDIVINTFGPSLIGFTAQLDNNNLEKLRNHKHVLYVEQDRVMSLSKSLKEIRNAEIPEVQVIPWGIERTGSGDGTGKVAWIIDSGVDMDHPDLNIDRKQSISFLNGKLSRNADDQYGHGTHISGIIAAKDNNIGVKGVAAGATIISVKVLDRLGRGTYSDVINAVNYVYSKAKPGDVVNLSLNGDTSFALESVIRTTASKGIYFTLSAGNDGDDSKYYSPGRMQYENVFTISAMSTGDKWAYYSNYGNPPIKFCAPGTEIYSTFKGRGYALMDGTSMASPHVAGLLLLNNGVINTDGNVINDIDGNPDPIAHK